MRQVFRTWHLLAAVALTVISIHGCRYVQRTYPDRSHPMTELTRNMRTHCFGRMLIDLPASTPWPPDSGSVSIDEVDIEPTPNVTKQAFDEKVDQRWRELQAQYVNKSVRPPKAPQRSLTAEGGVLFEFDYIEIEGPNFDGVWRKELYNHAEGYFWRDGTMFKLGPKLNGSQYIAKLMPRLHARKPDSVPLGAGLCLNGAWMSGYNDFGETERVTAIIDLPKGMTLTLSHERTYGPRMGMFERERESRAEGEAFLKAFHDPAKLLKSHTFRNALHRVGEMEGEEVVVGAVQGTKEFGYSTTIDAGWEYAGRGLPAPVPTVHINLSVPDYETATVPTPPGGFPDPKDVPGTVTEAEFFEVWDAVVGSIRPRPGALAMSPRKESSVVIDQSKVEADKRALDAFIARPPGHGKALDGN